MGEWLSLMKYDPRALEVTTLRRWRHQDINTDDVRAMSIRCQHDNDIANMGDCAPDPDDIPIPFPSPVYLLEN